MAYAQDTPVFVRRVLCVSGAGLPWKKKGEEEKNR